MKRRLRKTAPERPAPITPSALGRYARDLVRRGLASAQILEPNELRLLNLQNREN